MSGEYGFGTHPFVALTPERVRAAVERLGVPCDGCLFARNRCENRVYQVSREGAEPVIAKFYRPGHWSDVPILLH
jgi:Ser/Thr protein kinase RdoA (MazF antagonist)